MNSMTTKVAALLFLFGNAARSHAQNYVWATENDYNGMYGVSVDNSGNVYALGYNYVQKYNTSGNVQWSESILFPGEIIDMASDPSGNTYYTGWYGSDSHSQTVAPVTVGTGNAYLPVELVPSWETLGHRMVLMKVNTSGNLVWAKTYSADTDASIGHSVTTDASGNVYLLTDASGVSSFGTLGTVSASPCLALVKIDASGNEVYVKNVRSGYGDLYSSGVPPGVNNVAVNSSGDVVVLHNFSGTRTFDPAGSAVSVSSAGNYDLFVSRYSSAGTFQWVKTFGGTSLEVPCTVLLDDSGNTYASGLFSLTVDFNPASGAFNVANKTSNGGLDMFVMSLNSSGAYRYVSTFGNAGSEERFSMIQTSFDLIISGAFTGTVDFNPGAGSSNLTSAGGSDIFTASYAKSASVAPTMCYRLGGSGDDKVRDIAKGWSGSSLTYYQGGTFSGTTVDFNPSGAVDLLSGPDGFVTKMGLDEPSGLVVSRDVQATKMEAETTGTMTVYPSPFSDHVNIMTSEPGELSVFTLSGHLLKARSVKEAGTVAIDLSDLNAGIYLVEYKTSSGTQQKRIVKQ